MGESIRREQAAAKRVLLAAGLFLFVVSGLRSTDLGLKFLAGWTRAGVYSPPPEAIDRLGFGAGFDFWMFKNFGLEVDAFYCRKGYDLDWIDEVHGFSEISFPVLLKARVFLDKSSTVSLSAFGGGRYSRFLTDMDPNYGQHDWGIVAGGSVEKRLSRTVLSLEGRYDWGLLYQSDEYMPGRFEFKTRTFFLLAGVRLPL